MARWICDRRLYRTKKGKIVEEGDARVTDGAVLVATPGMDFPEKPIIEKLESKAIQVSEESEGKPTRNRRSNGKTAEQEGLPPPPPPMPDDNGEDDGEEDG
jgi:hypothetical protein